MKWPERKRRWSVPRKNAAFYYSVCYNTRAWLMLHHYQVKGHMMVVKGHMEVNQEEVRRMEIKKCGVNTNIRKQRKQIEVSEFI
jgi:hypothetical protein